MDSAQLTPTVLIALFGWIPVVLILFLALPIRQAILASFLIGWLFLPQAELELRGALPNYDRNVAVHMGVLMALAVLDLRRLLRFRPHLIDLPALAWCAAPFVSSVTNGLGAYDGASGLVGRTIAWGIPYVVGRIYFSDREGLRQLALAFVAGGLMYVPFCIYEIIMSPQLHPAVYGFRQHEFSQTYRFGGWRPMVFLQHGLAVALWMSAATLLGAWLWSTGVLRRYGGVTIIFLVGLVATTLLTRSLGALTLMGAGILVLLAGRGSRSRTSWPLVALLALSLLYMTVRITDTWAGEGLVPFVEQRIDPDRAQSMVFRIQNETALIDKALLQPVFGWGGYGRAQIRTRSGELASTVDGMWINALGENGFVGLAAFTALFLVPVGFVIKRVPPSLWRRPQVAPAAGLAVFLAIYLLDCLLNAMFNPFAPVSMGALGGALIAWVLVPRPGESALCAEARARWGTAQVTRRQLLLREALAHLSEEDRERHAAALEQALLSLAAPQVKHFMGLTPEDRLDLLRAWSGDGAPVGPPEVARTRGGRSRSLRPQRPPC